MDSTENFDNVDSNDPHGVTPWVYVWGMMATAAPDVRVTEYGRSASLQLASSIEHAKAGRALAPVTVVVPSNFAGLAARRLLGSGLVGVNGIANVNFLTPFRLAELLAVGQLKGRKPLTNPVLGAAVRRALADDPHHFRTVRDHQATERALAAMVGEVSNVSAAGRQAIRDHGGSASSVMALYSSITSHLSGFHDEADVARAAAHRPDLAAALEPFGQIIWYLPGPISAPLASFMRAVVAVTAPVVIVATAHDDLADTEVARTLRIAGVPFDRSRSAEPSTQVPPTQAAPTQAPLANHIISVTDADEEVRAVVREVMQLVDSGTPLDRIGIFHPVPDPYVRILEQQFAAAGIPANGPSRRRISDTIAGRVLLGALALPNERWRRDKVVALINSGPLRHRDSAARPAVWDQLSRYAGVVGGLSDWRAKLKVEAHRLDTSIDEAEASGKTNRIEQFNDRRADVDDLALFIDDLADKVQAVESAAGWQARSQATSELLTGLLGAPTVRHWWPEVELAGFEAVESALERLAALETIDPDPTMAVFVRALTSELAVARGRSGRFGNGVVYGPLATAPGQDLDAVFILGCAEGLCPAPRREDGLLSDTVRKLAGGDLPLRLGQVDEQRRLFLAAIASAPPERRWLFFPRGDLRSNRRSRPSRWLLPTASKLAGKPVYGTDFDDGSPPGIHEVASHATALCDASYYTSVDERDLAVVHQYVVDGGNAPAHPVAELVAQGMRMQQARQSSDFTEFDGNIAAAGGFDPGAQTQSASRLETWATCGFRYFLGYVLGLDERDDPERTVELSALDRGSAMHEVLERFIEEQIDGGAQDPDEPWSPQQRARAQELASEVFDEFERRGRTGRPIEWETQKSDLLALIDDFLTSDDGFRRATQATPSQIEFGFGMGQSPPLRLRLVDGRTLSFRGKIDRIDQTRAGHHVVSDYKTGRGSNYKGLDKEDDPTRAGTMLQLGLYAEAAAQHLGAEHTTTSYWMVNTAAGFARHGYGWTPEHRRRLLDVLATIADGIDNGVFAANPGEWQSYKSSYENCSYCAFDSVCPKGRAEHSADKAHAPELEVRVALTLRPESDDLAPAGS